MLPKTMTTRKSEEETKLYKSSQEIPVLVHSHPGNVTFKMDLNYW